MSTRDTEQTQFPIRMLNEAELDVVSGGSFRDLILRLFAKDFISGGLGNDYILPGPDGPPPIISGGGGNDVFFR